MNKEELAQLLDGRDYRKGITKEEEQLAKENNLVVVLGASDDLIELYGALEDEIDAYNGAEIPVSFDEGIIKNKCNEEDCPYYSEKVRKASFYIHGEYAKYWEFDIKGHHPNYEYATFDIFDDGELFCKGIVFEYVQIPF